MSSDTLRVSIFREVMNLQEDKLLKVHSYIESLVSNREQEEKEYTMPEDLLHSLVEYSMKATEEGRPLYSTAEVDDYVNKKMGWK